MKCPEWIDSWKSEYDAEADCEVLKADIKIVMRRDNGEIVIRHSEYRANDLPIIQIDNISEGIFPAHENSRRW